MVEGRSEPRFNSLKSLALLLQKKTLLGRLRGTADIERHGRSSSFLIKIVKALKKHIKVVGNSS